MKKLILIFLSVFSSLSLAGGDYWKVGVTESQGTYEHLKIKLSIVGEPRDIVNGCKQIEVEINHKRSLLYRLLPFIKTVEPTMEEHKLAVDFLRKSFKNESNIHFGYIAGGLQKSNKNCTFKSNGFKLESIDEIENIIFSYP